MQPPISAIVATRLTPGVKSTTKPQTTASIDRPKSRYPKFVARFAQFEMIARFASTGSPFGLSGCVRESIALCLCYGASTDSERRQPVFRGE